MPSMSSDEGPARGLRPGAALRGALRAPGSKSIAQRALVCAALARGTTRLTGLPAGEDVRAARALVAACGAAVEPGADGEVRVTGAPPEGSSGWRPSGGLDLGESGTLARFALATVGLCAPEGTRARLAARGSLLRRSSPALLACLARAGVELTQEGWPIELVSHAPPERLRLEQPASSQEVSALLIALAALPDQRTLEVLGPIPSTPYVALTRGVLAEFAAQVESLVTPGGESFAARGPLRSPAGPLAIEADASLAAVALAAGCLSGGEVTATGLPRASAQGDVRIVEHLVAFGCRAEQAETGILASAEPSRGAERDLSGEPDLAPVLAAVAAAAAQRAPADRAWSELRGLGTLPGKESSRIELLARGLEQAGWQASASRDSLRIGPPRVPETRPVVLDPAGDHRMAFAFALLGLLRPGIAVANPGCVAKSWPSFWEDLARLGAEGSIR